MGHILVFCPHNKTNTSHTKGMCSFIKVVTAKEKSLEGSVVPQALLYSLMTMKCQQYEQGA